MKASKKDIWTPSRFNKIFSGESGYMYDYKLEDFTATEIVVCGDRLKRWIVTFVQDSIINNSVTTSVFSFVKLVDKLSPKDNKVEDALVIVEDGKLKVRITFQRLVF